MAVDLRTNGAVVEVCVDGRAVARVPMPVVAYGIFGAATRVGYAELSADTHRLVSGTATWSQSGVQLSVEDTWSVAADDEVTLRRRVRSAGVSNDDGIHIATELELLGAEEPRFFAPGMAYSSSQWAAGGTFSYADNRLAYPVVAAVGDGRYLSLARLPGASYDDAPQRSRGQGRFLQRTTIGSVGFRIAENSEVSNRLLMAWPYYEGERSAQLDAAGTPVSAQYPLDTTLDISLEYSLRVGDASDYADAAHSVFAHAAARSDVQPSPAPVTLEESVDLRLDSVAHTYVERDGFAGFVLNFDPERGYDSEAKAFGASFADHDMQSSHDLLEYGFTGRQLNLAYMLARRSPLEWLERGESVVDSFVERMTTPSGWVFTLWNLRTATPLYACGDPSGVIMHYLGESALAGTYTRMMAEAGRDLLLNLGLHAAHGREHADWLQAAIALGDFYVRTQESDGSWFRAYAPTGEPIVDTDWFGYRTGSGKTATAAVIPFLLALSATPGVDAGAYRAAARAAGEFVRESYVTPAEYRGGTLDNPNLVDKEASFIAMEAMLCLHDDASDDDRAAASWLASAHEAAAIAVTWHSIWEVPATPGTALAAAGVRSIGWGGINSVWGVGVTDIYSLFFAASLARLGRLAADPLFARVAELIAWSSLQILATPADRFGFADTGMQPEGIAFCSQGVDAGLIRKGDTWGGLGWPYTAGTFGLHSYLDEIHQRTTETPTDAINPPIKGDQ